MEFFERWFNLNLLREPMNWAIVGIAASITLLLMHVLMTAWQSMAGGSPSIAAGPGQIASPVPDVTTLFSQPGNYGSGPGAINTFTGIGTTIWTDGGESRFAEDGWYGNS